jgi:hypothetical protein
MRRPEAQTWPALSASTGGPELVRRWEALLGKAPRLRPWLGQMLGHKRLVLQQAGAAEVERILWDDLARWLQDFEALPLYAVAAIATTLQEERSAPSEEGQPETLASTDSPERSVSEFETLVSDPAFALAFHCVETCIQPALPAAPPEEIWFGLLHAGAKAEPQLTAQVAVALVLRVLSPGWANAKTPARQAALRLFHAGPADLRGDLSRLCAALPPEWSIIPEKFVAAAAAARVSFAAAADLCARFVAAARFRSGGLAVLQADPAPPPSPAELAELDRNARKYGHMAGFRQLLALL